MTKHDWDVHPGWKVGITPSVCSQCKVTSELDSSEISDWGCPGKVFTKGSLLDRRGGMVPTVQLGPNASQGVTPERQALLDIQEYMKNYDGGEAPFHGIQEIIDEALYE